MNFSPPDFILKAAQESLLKVENNHYSHPKGRIRLRNALSKAYGPFFNRSLDPESEVIVTAGANEGMFSILMGYLDEGDEVIVMEPFFDQYIPNITMSGGVPVYVPFRPHGDEKGTNLSSADWKIDLDELKKAITPRTKILMINTPHNPIGKVFSRAELEEISKIAIEHNLLIISDEVYDRLYYKPEEHVRIANIPGMWERTITVGSAGKTFQATGWRIGWLIGPKALISTALAAHTRIVFTTNSPLQEATAAGFEEADEHKFFESTVEDYTRRRDILMKGFDDLGLHYTIPQGGYFLLVNMARVQYPSDYPFPEVVLHRPRDFKVAYWLAKEIGVVSIPPTEFFSKEHESIAEDYLRFAFCKSDDVLHESVKRLSKLKQFIL